MILKNNIILKKNNYLTRASASILGFSDIDNPLLMSESV